MRKCAIAGLGVLLTLALSGCATNQQTSNQKIAKIKILNGLTSKHSVDGPVDSNINLKVQMPTDANYAAIGFDRGNILDVKKVPKSGIVKLNDQIESEYEDMTIYAFRAKPKWELNLSRASEAYCNIRLF